MPYCAFCGTQVEVGSRPCPACGRLPGGAPTVVVKQKGLSAAVAVAIVVGMAFLSIPFIGIIAAIAIPNFLNAIDRAKQKRDMADLESFGIALEAFGNEMGEYREADSVADLAPILVPKYMRSIPGQSAWNGEIRYECWQEDPASKNCDEFRVASPGKDGVFEHDSLRDYAPGEIERFDGDIVYGSSGFIQYPAGLGN